MIVEVIQIELASTIRVAKLFHWLTTLLQKHLFFKSILSDLVLYGW